MIDREAVKNQIKKGLEDVEIDLSVLTKIQHKIDATRDVIKDLETLISHSEGLSKILLGWHLDHLEENLTRCEILKETALELYDD